jgi:hypothetical protein
MNTKRLLPLWLVLFLPALAPAQPPPRPRPPLPPADRPRPPLDRPARTNDRPPRAGGPWAPRVEMPSRFQALPGPQIGLNFVRFFWDDARRGPAPALDCYQPDTIFRDLDHLGAETYRQFVKADLLWDLVESADDQWTFANADAVIPNSAFVAIPTLFAMQYASPTPPWETDPARFQKTIGPEARAYLETVVRRYADQVKYWEIGNEMEHWRIADPGDQGLARARQSDRVPDALPADGFSPREQGRFLAQAAAIIRDNDPDAVIVLPGLAGLSDYSLDTWLPGVVAGGGTDWFDVVNYHDYSGWEPFVMRRPRLAAAMQRLGIADKPVWLTETGSSSDPTLTLRTDYPNSPETQAADIFRRIVQGYGFGDSLVVWHGYIPSSSSPQNDWRAYGVRDPQGNPVPAGHAFRLLTDELIPWSAVERLEADPRARNLYRFTLADGAQKIVAWGSGTYAVPAGFSQFTSVIPAASGAFAWQPVRPGDALPLSPNPILLK